MEIKGRAIFGGILIIIIGVFLIVGTKMKLKILVDPPQDWSPYWVHSWLKKYFDETILTNINYVFGVGFVIFGAVYLYLAISGKIVYRY